MKLRDWVPRAGRLPVVLTPEEVRAVPLELRNPGGGPRAYNILTPTSWHGGGIVRLFEHGPGSLR